MDTLLVYGTYSGSTLHAAEIIQDTLGKLGHRIVLRNVRELDPSELEHYDSLIFGTNTWLENKEEGSMNGGYYKLKEKLSPTAFANKKIAVYGLGDSHQYNTTFCKSVDHLTKLIEEHGGKVASALRVDRFYFEKMNNTVRIQDWAKEIENIIG